MTEPRGRHAKAPDHDDADGERRDVRGVAARTFLVSGRVLPVLAVAAVVWARSTEDSWRRATLDEAGYTTAWAPNVAMLLIALTIAVLPYLVLPMASSGLAERDGDTLTVPTVLGRRSVALVGAQTWRARMPGEVVGLQVVVVTGSTGWVILMASEAWLDPGQTPLGDVGEGDQNSGRNVTFRGWALMLAWVLLIFVGFGIGGSVAGTF
ncbi:hypothetical protein [Antribacter gilvus]|uniref:hypothetical protein n=1 Tax=Antribacter gilvus TaxID=2304675 RepID=UPI000F79B5E1|nr:hypothetical protein [Antribacter gilvus]